MVDHYRRRDDGGALAILDSANMTSYPQAVLTRAAIYAQLGRLQERAVWRDVETRFPEFAARFDEGLTSGSRMWRSISAKAF